MPAFALQAFGLRFRFAFLGRRRCAPRVRPQRLDIDLDVSTERPLGCGWFDSSLDLAEGLSVREHASVEAVAQELPLADWLHFHAQGWRGAPLR